MKKILVLFLTLQFIFFSSQLAFSGRVKITAYHDGSKGLEKLYSRVLLLQIPAESFFKVKTDANAVFELSDIYAEKEVRAYLINFDGKILAGCFSDFTPVKLGKITLKGIDCL